MTTNELIEALEGAKLQAKSQDNLPLAVLLQMTIEKLEGERFYD